MQKTQRQMPAIQRIQEKTNPVVEELSWIKSNSPSTKARRQAGKAILSFELGEVYAEKAYNFHEQKEQQSEEYNSRQSKQQGTRRFQGQES